MEQVEKKIDPKHLFVQHPRQETLSLEMHGPICFLCLKSDSDHITVTHPWETLEEFYDIQEIKARDLEGRRSDSVGGVR